MCAWQKAGQKAGQNGENYGQAAREEAIRMRDAIVARIGKISL